MNAKKNKGWFKIGHTSLKPEGGITFNCVMCGKKRHVRKNKKSKYLYCSLSCSGKSRKKYSEDFKKIIDRQHKKEWKMRNKNKIRITERKRWKIRARKNGILPHISKEENFIYKNLLKQYKPEEIFRNYRGIIRNPYTNYPLELDFFIPKENKAIEVNGFCHRNLCRGGISKLIERKRNDKIKKNECDRLGIKLEIINV